MGIKKVRKLFILAATLAILFLGCDFPGDNSGEALIGISADKRAKKPEKPEKPKKPKNSNPLKRRKRPKTYRTKNGKIANCAVIRPVSG